MVLPEGVQASLRASFADEVSARLPRLAAGTDLEAVRRDAHTLASSAWVVDEPEIARLAREVELGGDRAALVEALTAWTQ